MMIESSKCVLVNAAWVRFSAQKRLGLEERRERRKDKQDRTVKNGAQTRKSRISLDHGLSGMQVYALII